MLVGCNNVAGQALVNLADGSVLTQFPQAQRSALIIASEAAYDIRPTSSTDEAIAAVRDRLMQRGSCVLG
jgi:hypothetical protein